MKKIIFTLLLALITLFFVKNISAEEVYENAQSYNNVELEYLNSKDLNEIFNGMLSNIIEIEVSTQAFTKSYRFNSGMTSNIEKELLKKVTKDLIDMNKREMATTYQISGVKITKIGLMCTQSELQLIKERLK